MLLNYAAIIVVAIIAVISCSKENAAKSTANTPQPVTASVSDSGLICYLPFHKNLNDASGHGNNGTVQNGSISYVNDKFGNKKSALSLLNTNAFIEVPEKDIAGLTKATFSVDFYPTEANGSSQYLMSKMSYDIPQGSPGFYQSLRLGFTEPYNLTFDVRSNGDCDADPSTGWNEVVSDSSFILNAWNNVTVIFNDNLEKIYLNGKLANTTVKHAAAVCSGEPVRLGVWWQQDPSHFNGYLDEFRVYNRALSANEIKQLAKQ